MRAAVAIILIGCGTPVVPAASDAGAEVAVDVAVDTANDEVLLPAGTPIRCGPGPYVEMTRTYSSMTTKKPLVGKRVGTSACPGIFTQTDEGGRFTIFHTFGTRYATLTHLFEEHGIADGEHLAISGGEDAVQFGAFVGNSLKVDGVRVSQITPAIIISPYINGSGPEECRSATGTTLTVEGAPEARVHYWQPGEFEPTGTHMWEGGWTMIDHLPSSGAVTLRASHPKCAVTPHHFDTSTGRTLIFPGYHSGATVLIGKPL